MGRPAAIVALTLLLAAAPVRAADTSDAAAPAPAGAAASAPPADLQGLIDHIQDRLAKINQAAGANGAALDFLQQQVDRAIERLNARQDENDALRGRVDSMTKEEDVLRHDLDRSESSRKQESLALNQQIDGLRSSLAESRQQLAALQAEVGRLNGLLESEKQAASGKLADARQERDKAVSDLQAQVAKLSDMLLAERDEKDKLNDDLVALRRDNADAAKELRATLAEMRQLRADLDTAKTGGDDLQQQVQASQARTAAAEDKLDLVNRQLGELQRQLASLNTALEASEAKNADQKNVIFELEKRLNQALASKTLELARYRSEFFGRLREVLGNRDDIGIVGDRFVFQAEVLFASGEATLGPAGRAQMTRFADTLKQVAAEIPPDINWILRVDGHTDNRPISNDRFASNWELSTARATEVVRYLVSQGVPPERLMAAGLGEYHPIAEGDSREALRRNRRIEFRLDAQ